MSIDFDRFPLGNPLIKKNDVMMSPDWNSFMETFYENLISYLTQGGILPPNLTLAQIVKLFAPKNGQLLYNITIDAPQFYQVSSKSWRTITFT